MKDNIFKNIKKDLTISCHYSIKQSIVELIKKDAKDNNLSESKIVNTILENYYQNKNST